MPLTVHRKWSNPDHQLLIWTMSESVHELASELVENGDLGAKLDSIRLEKRKLEWLSIQVMMKRFFSQEKMEFLENGKPVLISGRHISISHCGNLAGLIMGDFPTGLDIQDENPTILRISDKFLNDYEKSFCLGQQAELTFLAMVWSVKEAVFKFFGEKVTFAEDIQVRRFNITDEILWADYQGVYGKFEFGICHENIQDKHIIFIQTSKQL